MLEVDLGRSLAPGGETVRTAGTLVLVPFLAGLWVPLLRGELRLPLVALEPALDRAGAGAGAGETIPPEGSGELQTLVMVGSCSVTITAPWGDVSMVILNTIQDYRG